MPAASNMPDRAPAPVFVKRSRRIVARHNAQTIETVTALQRKYDAPVFGRVSPWTLIEMLAECFDPTDELLYGVSQQIHVLQIIEAAEAKGVADDALVFAALIHDLGKVLLLTAEAPENVVCINQPIGRYEPGIGLDNCVMQWNHDEFAYSRLKAYLPDETAWLLRYHSIERSRCDIYMDARDRAYADGALKRFAQFDQGSKSRQRLPRRPIEAYRHILERMLPPTILF